MSTAAKAKGIKGVIIKGGCRDLAEHRELGFPVSQDINLFQYAHSLSIDRCMQTITQH